MKTKLQPMYDRILVKAKEAQETTAAGLYIPDNAKERPMMGEVLAVGTGRVLQDGTLRPLAVKKGDVVLYGKYTGSEIRHQYDEFVILREEEVLAIVVEA
jgi:chaperonin GroES